MGCTPPRFPTAACAPPEQVAYQIEGALASSIAAHEVLVTQQSCVILATNALDDRT
jgi:hypothetical protein